MYVCMYLYTQAEAGYVMCRYQSASHYKLVTSVQLTSSQSITALSAINDFHSCILTMPAAPGDGGRGGQVLHPTRINLIARHSTDM